MKVKSLSPTLSNPMDCSLPGSSVHVVFQARVLEWGAIAFSKVKCAKLLQSFLTLCDPIDGSPPGSLVPRILQARILEWVAISCILQCMKVKSESVVYFKHLNNYKYTDMFFL